MSKKKRDEQKKKEKKKEYKYITPPFPSQFAVKLIFTSLFWEVA